jgi:hypothetical protein
MNPNNFPTSFRWARYIGPDAEVCFSANGITVIYEQIQTWENLLKGLKQHEKWPSGGL